MATDTPSAVALTPEPQCSVQIESRAKGAPSITVKAYAVSADEAAAIASRVYDELVQKYASQEQQP